MVKSFRVFTDDELCMVAHGRHLFSTTASCRRNCLQPQKYRALMNFLSNVLREDGGFEYKKAIVDSILILIREIPDAKESGLAHLCEFIEVIV